MWNVRSLVLIQGFGQGSNPWVLIIQSIKKGKWTLNSFGHPILSGLLRHTTLYVAIIPFRTGPGNLFTVVLSHCIYSDFRMLPHWETVLPTPLSNTPLPLIILALSQHYFPNLLIPSVLLPEPKWNHDCYIWLEALIIPIIKFLLRKSPTQYEINRF